MGLAGKGEDHGGCSQEGKPWMHPMPQPWKPQLLSGFSMAKAILRWKDKAVSKECMNDRKMREVCLSVGCRRGKRAALVLQSLKGCSAPVTYLRSGFCVSPLEFIHYDGYYFVV